MESVYSPCWFHFRPQQLLMSQCCIFSSIKSEDWQLCSCRRRWYLWQEKGEERCVWADCCGMSCLAPEGQASWGLTFDKSWFRNTRDTSQQQCHHPPSTQHCSVIAFKDCLVYPVISHSLIIIHEATWSFPKTSASDAQTATWCHTSRHLWNVYVQQALHLLLRSF